MLQNKIVRLLLSIVVALGLWFYVITAVSTEYDQTFSNIPVVFQGQALLEDRGLMVMTEGDPTVTLTLYGKRADLSKLDSSNLSVTVDLSRISEAGTHSLSTSNISYPGNVPSDAFTVLSRSPSIVKLTVEQKIRKEVPVVIAYSGSVPEDFIADQDNAELDYNSITIEGPASVIDQIAKARVEVDLEGKNVSFSESYRYTLCDAQDNPIDAANVETNVAGVNLTLYIQRIKEIPLTLSIVEGGGATQRTSKIVLSHQTIKVAGNDGVLENFNEIILGQVDLSQIPEDTVMTFPIVLPTGVTNISSVAEATVEISFPLLDTKTFTVTNITGVNIPASIEAEILTQSMQVTIRGPRDIMKTMTESAITALVDFSAVQTSGTSTVKANIILSESYEEAGPIKADSVTVTVRQVEQEN